MGFTWSYVFYDLMTNEPLAALPLSQLSFSSQLNSTGSFSGTLNMSDARVQQALQGIELSQWPARTAMYIDCNGVLVFGGILWTVRFDQRSFTAALAGNDFWSYFSQARRITWSATYTSTDVLVVVRDLITSAQAMAGGDIGVHVPVTTSGELVTVKYDPTQVMNIGQAVSTLSSQSGSFGFDFAIDVAYDTYGAPQKYLTLSAPRRGRPAGSTGLVFDVGALSAQGYTWPLDGSKAANVVYGVGAGTGPGSLRSTQSMPGLIDAGYPLLEDSLSRSDITSREILDSVTASYLTAVALPVALPTITISTEATDPIFGSYIIGDDARIIVPPDEFFPNGLDEYWRITAWTVNLANEGVGTITLTLSLPPVTL